MAKIYVFAKYPIDGTAVMPITAEDLKDALEEAKMVPAKGPQGLAGFSDGTNFFIMDVIDPLNPSARKDLDDRLSGQGFNVDTSVLLKYANGSHPGQDITAEELNSAANAIFRSAKPGEA